MKVIEITSASRRALLVNDDLAVWIAVPDDLVIKPCHDCDQEFNLRETDFKDEIPGTNFRIEPKPTENPITYVCDECGSDDITVEAYVRWCPVEQDFIVMDTCDKGHYCDSCDGECRLKEIPLVVALPPEPMPQCQQPRSW